jgi:predicted secreted protein
MRRAIATVKRDPPADGLFAGRFNSGVQLYNRVYARCTL